MKFDVIIGNPPYQMLDGGGKAGAYPLYHFFVEQAIKLSPEHLTMIIPSKWFAGGKGLDGFRKKMMSDTRISHVVDYYSAKDCFPSVSLAGGVCYFLWSSGYNDNCLFSNVLGNKVTKKERFLNDYDVIIRNNDAINIIEKVKSKSKNFINEIVSSRNIYGVNTNVKGGEFPFNNALKLFSSSGEGYIAANEIKDPNDTLNSFKVMISKTISGHAGEPDKNGKFKVISKVRVLNPGEICTDSYLVGGKFKTLVEAKNFENYLTLKFSRFLLFQCISSINISKDKFKFVPLLSFKESWDDSKLYKMYNLTQSEVDLIEGIIKQF